MYPGPVGVFHCFPGLVHVVGDGPGQGGDDGTLDLPGDIGDRLEITRGAGSESGLDNVHPHSLQLAGDLHFFVPGHTDSGGLLSVSERGVQEQYFVVSHF